MYYYRGQVKKKAFDKELKTTTYIWRNIGLSVKASTYFCRNSYSKI
jgi:hypothetical protein